MDERRVRAKPAELPPHMRKGYEASGRAPVYADHPDLGCKRAKVSSCILCPFPECKVTDAEAMRRR